jgi:hypothetical protein
MRSAVANKLEKPFRSKLAVLLPPGLPAGHTGQVVPIAQPLWSQLGNRQTWEQGYPGLRPQPSHQLAKEINSDHKNFPGEVENCEKEYKSVILSLHSLGI